MCAGEAREEDADLLKNIADQIAGRTICAFGEAAAWPVQSFIAKFKDEFIEKAQQQASLRKEGKATATETTLI
jgi:NADH-quinone oxidoreductase subunit F